MNTTITRSQAALTLLRASSDDIVTDDSNREVCRELVAGHNFTGSGRRSTG